jgi:MEMO1 family protein
MTSMRHTEMRPENTDVRRCAVCGTFYPGDPAALAGLVDRLLVAPTQRRESIRGVIAPHAGYMYSGSVAGQTYGHLIGRTYETVVVVSPSHHEFFEGVSIFDGRAYATPLGEIPVDEELRSTLTASPVVTVSRRGHGLEHALEVQLPFLQRTIGAFRLVPLVVGHQSTAVCVELARSLSSAIRGRDALLVASTDLSHFHAERDARTLDEGVMARIRRYEETALMQDLDAGTAEACGGGPVVAVMDALRQLGCTQTEIVAYATSGEVTHDRESVVGYAGAVIA